MIVAPFMLVAVKCHHLMNHAVLWSLLWPFVPKAADEAFDVEREKAKEADALAQVFRISGDLVKSRLLISQVKFKAIAFMGCRESFLQVAGRSLCPTHPPYEC